MSVTLRQRGASLVEIMVSIAIFATLISMIGSSVLTQINVIGDTADVQFTVVPAEVCLQRIRNELKQAVRKSPGYAISETSVSFRPVLGYLDPASNAAATALSEGRLSANSIEYERYLKTIAYDAANQQVTLTVTGTLPTGMKSFEILCRNVPMLAGNVNPLRFLNGDSTSANPSAATDLIDVIMIRLTASRLSSAPGTKNAFNTTGMISSDVRGVVLSTKVRIFQELLVNSTRGAVTGA